MLLCKTILWMKILDSFCSLWTVYRWNWAICQSEVGSFWSLLSANWPQLNSSHKTPLPVSQTSPNPHHSWRHCTQKWSHGHKNQNFNRLKFVWTESWRWVWPEKGSYCDWGFWWFFWRGDHCKYTFCRDCVRGVWWGLWFGGRGFWGGWRRRGGGVDGGGRWIVFRLFRWRCGRVSCGDIRRVTWWGRGTRFRGFWFWFMGIITIWGWGAWGRGRIEDGNLIVGVFWGVSI